MDEAVLAEEDVRAIVRLLAKVAIVSEGVMAQKRCLVEGLAELLDADRYMWNVTRYEPGLAPVALSLVHNWSDEELAAHAHWNYSRPDNKFTRAIADLLPAPVERPWTRSLEQLVGPDWWANEVRQNKSARGSNIGTAMLCVCSIPGRPNTHSMLGVQRVPGRPEFSARDQRIAHVVFTEVAWLHSAEVTPEEDGSRVFPLSPSKQTVLTQLIDGKVPKEIAKNSELTVNTVRTYIRDIYRHFEVSGREELMRRFMTGDGGDRIHPSDSSSGK